MSSAAPEAVGGDAQPRFFPALLSAMQGCAAQGQEMQVEAFAGLMDVMVGFFDHLGPALHIAKAELVGKTQSLHKAAQGGISTLRELVQADVAAKRATVKDSCTRNLHRLITAVGFVRGLLEQFVASPATTPCNAARQAYEQSLGKIHTYMVRSAVWASLYMLPTRQHFMISFGETEESASGLAPQIVKASHEVEGRVLELLSGIAMPVASASSGLLSGLMGSGSGSGGSNSGKGNAAAATAATEASAPSLTPQAPAAVGTATAAAAGQ